jgi:glycosyltransferase involved in cell wall biosynthesis
MKPRLAFVSQWNAAHPNVESGYPFSMRRQLQKHFEVVDVFPMGLPGEKFWLPVRAGYKIAGRYHHPMREPSILKRLARRIEPVLRAVKADVIFAPSSLPMSFVETSCPWMYATDQLFCDFVETYICRPSARFRRLGNEQEARSLANAARATYPSDWAARSAVNHYGGDPSKIRVIPWGANLPCEIAGEDVAAAISRRRLDRCDLVFIGRDWGRKGGDILVATIEALNRSGLPAHATIIGCKPPALPADRFTIYEFLDKGRSDHLRLFTSIMLGAHFLFLPSRAEAYGQAFCEAMAFGVPAIGSTAGGIPTIIRDGQNGFVRPVHTPPAEFAVLITQTLADPAQYLRLARAAREDYRDRLNWDSFGEQLSDIVAALV